MDTQNRQTISGFTQAIASLLGVTTNEVTGANNTGRLSMASKVGDDVPEAAAIVERFGNGVRVSSMGWTDRDAAEELIRYLLRTNTVPHLYIPEGIVSRGGFQFNGVERLEEIHGEWYYVVPTRGG